MQENNDLTASVHNLETSSTVFELNQENGTWLLRFNSSILDPYEIGRTPMVERHTPYLSELGY